MDSETKIDRRYADLTMIIRPDKRYGKVFDVLIEFKFVKLKDAGTDMTADKAQQLSGDELMKIPEISKQLQDGANQVHEYGQKLEQRYGNLRLQKFVVVALGFERICFRKLGIMGV